MTNSQRLAAVREMLRAWFQERNPQETWDVVESIMIRDGFYCGRNFRFAMHRAVWFVEEEQVKIYDGDGKLLDSFSTTDLTAPIETLKLHSADLQPAVEPQQPAVAEPATRRAA